MDVRFGKSPRNGEFSMATFVSKSSKWFSSFMASTSPGYSPAWEKLDRLPKVAQTCTLTAAGRTLELSSPPRGI